MSFRNLKFIFIFLFFSWSFWFAPGAEALTIAPSLVKLELNPGETKTQTLNLFNETDQTITFYSQAENFSPDKVTNAPIFLGNIDPSGAARWFAVAPAEVELKSGERKEVGVRITAPVLAEPGGHYAAVLWSDVPPKDGGLKTANRLAVLYLLTIKGEIQENLKIISFAQNKTGDFNFDLEVENEGNVHLQPFGQVQIFDGGGKQVALIPINALKQNVLPQSRRNFNLFLSDDLGWGKYRAKAQIYFGQKGMMESQEIVFWKLPRRLLFNGFGAAIVLLIIFLIFKIAKNKSSNV